MQKKIIHFLKNSREYLSGEEISQQLKITRAGIWKHIQELRKQGYEIEAVPHKGYRLKSSPDKLSAHEIGFNLGTTVFGKDIVCKETVSSTMDEAMQLGIEGSSEGTVICAENQQKGRGRLGRPWISPKGKGVYMSVVLRPKLSPMDVAKLTLLGAVAACEALRDVSGADVQIKWPNDLYIGGRKLCGILTELSAEVDRVNFVVIGMGINVNTPASSLPPEGTSLKIEKQKPFSRVQIVQEILRALEKWYLALPQQGFGPVFTRWKGLSMTLGKRVRISDPAGVVEGKAVDLSPEGGLLICNDEGDIIKRMSGDVQFVRTAS